MHNPDGYLPKEVRQEVPILAMGPQFENALAAVRAERMSQLRVWGHQQHADGIGGDHREIEMQVKALNDAAEITGTQTWSRIALEEDLEVLTVDPGDLIRLYHEVVQAAAVYTAWAEHILERIKKGQF